ncbi:AraC family transcriptional regulator [Dysgonomonas capnocytophagoides]|uniref:AraC family transcriptional regulator n=1 Tax=Dysgonomonas capnocytophagoides TaxID=45254 RepID=A0A4Y8KX10_9BACT|nr:helix-turn-helix domain-containing protein [Dysgonomonas capnocytophagoides]TFD93761.1 AraC family transcriptional regulator [Dysgonomonas capnocytophagoides]
MNTIENIKAQTIRNYFSAEALEDSFFILENKARDPDNVSKYIVSTDFPIKLDIGIAIVCEAGCLNINIGYSNYKVGKNDFINILADRVFQVIEVSEDFEAKILCLKPSYLEIDNTLHSFNIRNILYEFPHHTLTDSKMKLFYSLFDYCQDIIRDTENIFRKQLIRSVLNTMFLEVCNMLMQKSHSENKTDDIRNEMFTKFMKHVELNFKKDRSIRFYAEKAHLTPKYFSSIIFRLTGKHAKVWIDEYVILEIKALLKSTNLTIQQISYDLNFATPSHFSRYFKHHTGISPNEYRNR